MEYVISEDCKIVNITFSDGVAKKDVDRILSVFKRQIGYGLNSLMADSVSLKAKSGVAKYSQIEKCFEILKPTSHDGEESQERDWVLRSISDDVEHSESKFDHVGMLSTLVTIIFILSGLGFVVLAINGGGLFSGLMLAIGGASLFITWLVVSVVLSVASNSALTAKYTALHYREAITSKDK